MKFWPFVIAVGKYEDFDFVVLPDVIPERSKNFWRVSAFRANKAEEQIRVFETLIDDKKAVCVYRTTHVENASTQRVLDSAGRPIFKSVGFLTFEKIGDDEPKWSADLAAIGAEYADSIERFVNYQSPPEPEWTPVVSQERTHRPPQQEHRFLRALLVSCLVLSVLLNLVQFFFIGGFREQNKILVVDTDALRRQNSKLVDESDALRGQNGNLVGERDALNTKTTTLVGEKEALNARITDLVREREALREERDRLAKPPAVMEEKSPTADAQPSPNVEAQPAPK